jgi:hypothetical protein
MGGRQWAGNRKPAPLHNSPRIVSSPGRGGERIGSVALATASDKVTDRTRSQQEQNLMRGRQVAARLVNNPQHL